MQNDLRDFWQRFQSGIQVVVAGDLPDKLLGVRDGFHRFFVEGTRLVGLGSEPEQGDPLPTIPLKVVPEALVMGEAALPLEDLDILALARQRADDLVAIHGETFGFCVAVEAGLLSLEGPRLENESADSVQSRRQFVRSWAVLRGLGEETWGSSGSLQLPTALSDGLDQAAMPFVIPGRRRDGGMFGSLTGGMEDRRSSTALATFHAVSSLMYRYIESHPPRRQR